MKRYGSCFGLLSLIATFVLVQSRCQAQPKFRPDEVLKPDSSLIVGRLANGLTYYIRENRKPEKRAELRLVVDAGSILEDNDQQGLAHFVEHMAFDGTKDFPRHEIIDFLEKSGVRFGADLNASTGFDATTYFMQVPTDSTRLLKTGFKILEEWSHDVTFNDSMIDRERGIIREEWRLGRGAQERVWRQHYKYLFYNSRYAERIPIGKIGIIDSCSHDAIRRFYRDWYRPDLMAVIAVGDFDKNEIEGLIKKDFSDLNNPANERVRENYPIPGHTRTLVSVATDKELSQTSVNVLYLRDAQEGQTVGDYRNLIIRHLYDGLLNERLSEILHKPNPPFILASSGDGRMTAGKEIYSLGALVADTSIIRGLEAITREGDRVKQYGFKASELDRQKADVMRQMEKAFEERDKTESRQFVNEYERNFLYHEAIPGIATELALYREFLPGITLEEVDNIGSKRMTDDNTVVLISAPQKKSVIVPTEKEVLAIINGKKTGKLNPYVDIVDSKPLIAESPTLGKVVKEKKIAPLGVTEWSLSNGAKVVLKPTDFKNDEILFAAFSRGGSSLVPDSNYLSTVTAPQIVTMGGIGGFDAVALRKKLAGKVVSVIPGVGDLWEGLQGSSSPKDITTLFQLIYLYATAPRMDSASFDAYMTRWKEYLQDQSANPQTAFNDTVRVTLTNYHFRGRPITSELLNEVHLNDALGEYEKLFSNFDGFTFFFVGNFQPDSLKPLVEEYLASLPSLGHEGHWKDVGIRYPKGVIKKEVRKGIEPKSTVELAFTGPFEWTEQNRYDFDAMVELLNIKLREVMREEESEVYGVGVRGERIQYPRSEYELLISWGCDPKNVDTLIASALGEIDSLKTLGPDSVSIEKVKEIETRTYQVDLKQNSFWLWNLYNHYYNNENPELILKYPNLVGHLTASSLRTAVNKYFNMEDYVQVVLYPEK